MAKDRNDGRDGYVPCPMCGKWVKVRDNGRVFSHRTRRAKVTCLGGRA
jgi:endogenous inhibitor of DNA gyrase (YacG/DUF329 family)